MQEITEAKEIAETCDNCCWRIGNIQANGPEWICSITDTECKAGATCKKFDFLPF